MYFVCETQGCELDTRHLISQVNSEDVRVQLGGMSDPYWPMPGLAILRVLHGWGIRIYRGECI